MSYPTRRAMVKRIEQGERPRRSLLRASHGHRVIPQCRQGGLADHRRHVRGDPLSFEHKPARGAARNSISWIAVGDLTIKMSGHAPFDAQVMLTNDHEYEPAENRKPTKGACLGHASSG